MGVYPPGSSHRQRGMNHDESYYVGCIEFCMHEHKSESAIWRGRRFYHGKILHRFRLKLDMVCSHALPLTCLCPKSFRIVASFLVLAYWRWETMAGLGSLQSTDSRWSHMSARCRWGCFRLGSKQWTSHPALARERSRDRSSPPNLQPSQQRQTVKCGIDKATYWISIVFWL